MLTYRTGGSSRTPRSKHAIREVTLSSPLTWTVALRADPVAQGSGEHVRPSLDAWGMPSKCCYTGDPAGSGLGVIEACSFVGVDAVEELGEDVGAVVVAVVDGVVVLASEDLDELGSGVVEAAAFADGLELAVEGGGPCAVAVAEEPAVVGSEAAHVAAGRFGGERLGAAGVVLDGFGHPEVLIPDGAGRDPGV